MTNPEAEVTNIQVANPQESSTTSRTPQSPFAHPLPHARVGGISGLLELIVDLPEGTDDIPRLAERIQLEVDDLLPIMDAAVMLGFAEVAQGDVRLTLIGQDFATTTILRSKDLFRQQVIDRVPLINSIVSTLQEKRNRSMRSDFFKDLLDEHFPHAETEKQFATAVDWGRYAELFEYDSSEDRLYLPDAIDDSEQEKETSLTP